MYFQWAAQVCFSETLYWWNKLLGAPGANVGMIVSAGDVRAMCPMGRSQCRVLGFATCVLQNAAPTKLQLV